MSAQLETDAATDNSVRIVEPMQTSPYVLIKPRSTPARTGPTYQVIATPSTLRSILHDAFHSQYLAVDLETRGNDPSTNISIVGIGLAYANGSAYIHVADHSRSDVTDVINIIMNHERLLAHNIYFDGGVLFRQEGRHPDWAGCTYALLSLIANEGWMGQSNSLGTAVTDILKWETNQKDQIADWLLTNGYRKGNHGGPDKGEMWRAPADVLGPYCVLDAEACYLLYTKHILPILEQFPALESFYREHFQQHILTHIEQKLHGISVDIHTLHLGREEVSQRIQDIDRRFRNHPLVRPYIEQYEHEALSRMASSEPKKLRKDGEVSKNWLKWEARYKAAQAGLDPSVLFNPGSGQQLVDLLYNHLGYPVRIMSEAGRPAVSIQALRSMGEVGAILVERAYTIKELGFLEDYCERTQSRSTIHPDFRMPGTCTGRLSGRNPNFQQLPKTDSMMSLFQARPGHVLVDLDLTALEGIITAEFSEDENMMLLYSDTAPPNDIHLFVAAAVPAFQERIRSTGWDPHNSTELTLAIAKKECKHERSLAKSVVYACTYGAGVDKVWNTLIADGVQITRDEVEVLHSTYWSLFSRVRALGQRLQNEWRENGGYILNGFGRPMCIPDDYRKDALNRFIQSTGHDILVRYVTLLSGELTRRGIPWRPILVDLHDATTIEVPADYSEAAVDCFNWAMDELNRQLNGIIRHRGVPIVGTNFSHIKEPSE